MVLVTLLRWGELIHLQVSNKFIQYAKKDQFLVIFSQNTMD
jgi:hypothetical protein